MLKHMNIWVMRLQLLEPIVIQLANKRVPVVMFVHSGDDFFREAINVLNLEGITRVRPATNVRRTSRDEEMSLGE